MMENLNQKIIFLFISVLFFVLFLIGYNSYVKENIVRVKEIVSPIEIVLANGYRFKIKDFQTFDSYYSENNKRISKNLNISEDEAFILGNLGKYWVKNFLENRDIKLINDDIIYYRYSYRTKFGNSPYAVKDGKPVYREGFEKQLKTIRNGNFVILNLDNDVYYSISQENSEKIGNNYVVVRKSHVKNNFANKLRKQKIIYNKNLFEPKTKYTNILDLGNMKIIVTDLMLKLVPDRKCSSDICHEIVSNINQAQSTIDMAIYGYSSTPEVETALKKALKRGVKIRLVYDTDSNGENIYPDTFQFVKMFSNTINDKNSPEVNKTMHNKFYIFDKKTVITGSANLSHTDMSGFNSNSIIVMQSEDIAKVYTTEFEQMYSGKFHNSKVSYKKPEINNIKIYFSPQDKSITNGILPLIRDSKKYVYIPSFVITHKGFVKELIDAKNRGVDVKVIIDSLNATGVYSKHKALREAGIPVKAENYAGKLHTKSIVIDDEYLVIGSMNFSSSGENKNDENVVILKNSEVAKFYRDFFLYEWWKIPDKWLKSVPRSESWDSIGSCSDGLDNNYDGKIDSEDIGCIKKNE